MSSETDVLLVLTNLPDADSADRVTKVVLESRAAACVNRMPGCASAYWWNGAIEHAVEIPLLIKTTRAAYPGLEAALRRAHPYEVPRSLPCRSRPGCLPIWRGWPGRPAGLLFDV